MASRGDEIIRYVFETSGSKELQAAARVLLETGEASEEVEASLRALADEFAKAGSASAALESYRALIGTQEQLATAVDKTGLRLRFAAEQEASTAAALRESEAALKDAKDAQAAYLAQADKTAEGQKAVRVAVQAAAAAQKSAKEEWKESNEVLKVATREYERTAAAQDKMEREAASLAEQLKTAGVSTEKLGDAQAELAQRTERAQAELDGMVQAARDAKAAADALAASKLADELADQAQQALLAAKAERDLAQAAETVARAQADTARTAERRAQTEATFIQQIKESVAQERNAARATEQLQRARDILAQRAQSGIANERNYAQTLGTSAAKIAAIGAAALGINSAVGLARSALSQLVDTAGQFQSLDVQLGAVFKDQAEEARGAIQQLAQDTPYQLSQISEAFVKLKAFGLDPLDGTYQAIADQAAKLGGQQETLTGITLALGQAWAKQKLQGEEILQLVERGVPVWELLQRATGKNVQELQKLSEAGKLGRAEIKLLIDEIGKSADGASAQLAGTLPGQINKLKSQWQQFLDTVANSGVLDYLQQQLAAVSEEVARMAASGELQVWAQDVSDAIVGAAEAIKGTIVFLVEHRDAILALAQAYGAAKLGSIVSNLIGVFGKLGPAVSAATTAMNASAISTTGMLGPLGALAAASTFTITRITALVDALGDLDSANKEVAARQAELAGETALLAQEGRALQEQYTQFASVAIASAEELATKGRDGLQQYVDQLKGAIDYQRGLGKEAIAAGDSIGRIAALGKIEELRAGLDAARARMVALHDASVQALAKVGEAGAKAAAAYDDLIAKGKDAREAVSKLFDDIHLTDAGGLAKVGDILHQVAIRGTEAGKAIRDELRDQVLKLSDQDFAKFRTAALEAFRDAKFGATDLGRALDGINLARLGVDIEQIKTGFSAAGKGAAEAFKGAIVEVDNLGLTAAQRAEAVGQAFDNAFGRAKTLADLGALKQALTDAFASGDIGVDAFNARIDQVKQKIEELNGATQSTGRPLPPPDTTQYRQRIDETVKFTGDAADRMAADQERMVEQQKSLSGVLGPSLEKLQGHMQAFAQVSDAAAMSYNALVEDLFRGAGAFSMEAIADVTGIRRFGEAVEQAAVLTEQAINRQRETVAALVDSYGALGDAQIVSMANIRGGIDELAESLRFQADEARAGRSEFELLGSTDLAPLVGALDAAAQRVDALRQKTEQATEAFEEYAASAREQLDQLNGDLESAEDRRFKRELENLREQAEAANALNSSSYNDAVNAAEALHRKKLQQIREQQEAQRRADEEANARAEEQNRRKKDEAAAARSEDAAASGTASTSERSVKVEFNGKDLGRVDITNNAELMRMAKALLPHLIEEIKRAARTSGAFGR